MAEPTISRVRSAPAAAAVERALPRWLIAAGDLVVTGGMDAANHALACFLAASGRETHLVAHRVSPELAGQPRVSLHAVPRPLGSHLLGFPLLERAARRQAARLRAASGRDGRRLVSLANGGNFPGEVVWLHYVHAAYRPEVARGALRRGLAALAHRRALRDERRVARGARLVIANSALTARHAVDLLGVPGERVHTVYYGNDAARFHPPTPRERRDARRALGLEGEGAVLAFVGALGDRRKGFATLFDAFARLAGAGEGWDATLLVAGTGAEVAAWSARARAAGLAGRIRFLGFQADVRPLLFASDLLVAPTRYEAYGLAVQEALCCAVPALVSRAAGVAERIPAALGALLLDDPGDAAELALRLRAWHARRDAHRAEAHALSTVLRGWTWNHMAARCVDIAEARA